VTTESDPSSADPDDPEAPEATDEESTKLPRELPPELAVIPRNEFRAVWERVTLVALRITKSKLRADQLMSDVYAKLVTTRRWDPSKKPLEKHLFGTVRSLLNIEYRSKQGEREALGNEGYHREVRPGHDVSVEDAVIEASDADARQTQAALEVEELRRRAASHPVMSGVLRCKSGGINKAADIARELNASPKEVYRAIELLKDHLTRMRAGKDER